MVWDQSKGRKGRGHMSTEHFDNWADNYKESILEELGEYKGQEHLDMLTTEALHDIYNEEQVQIKEED